jgi:hypothetical protein
MHAAEWIAVLVLMVVVLVGAGAVLLGGED